MLKLFVTFQTSLWSHCLFKHKDALISFRITVITLNLSHELDEEKYIWATNPTKKWRLESISLWVCLWYSADVVIFFPLAWTLYMWNVSNYDADHLIGCSNWCLLKTETINYQICDYTESLIRIKCILLGKKAGFIRYWCDTTYINRIPFTAWLQE